jgi:hypothetical protein
MIENARTGEQVEFVSESPEVLRMLTTWTRPGHRAAEHIHPRMEERFEVLEGRAAFRIDGVDIEHPRAASWSRLQAVVTSHGTDGRPVRLRIEMRPALRWREFTTRFFRGEDPVRLLAEYADEVRLPAD